MRCVLTVSMLCWSATGALAVEQNVPMTDADKPVMTPSVIAQEAMASSSTTGVGVPLTFLSIGTIIASPIAPTP